MIQKGANRWNTGLYYASFQGHIEIIRLMIEKGPTDLNSCLHHSCLQGHRDIVRLMIIKGADKCDCGKSIQDHCGTPLILY